MREKVLQMTIPLSEGHSSMQMKLRNLDLPLVQGDMGEMAQPVL